ncbi:MAG: hypothetical protein ACFFHD_14980 [Promethearchaeota archaeon]
MLFQLEYMEIIQILANIFGAILVFIRPIVIPIGEWMVGWITAFTEFLQQNFGTNLTLYIIIGIVLVASAIIVNVIWPGDRPGTIFSKDLQRIEKFEEEFEESEESEEKELIDDVRRCKECGNPIGDQDICPLCGARN